MRVLGTHTHTHTRISSLVTSAACCPSLPVDRKKNGRKWMCRIDLASFSVHSSPPIHQIQSVPHHPELTACCPPSSESSIYHLSHLLLFFLLLLFFGFFSPTSADHHCLITFSFTCQIVRARSRCVSNLKCESIRFNRDDENRNKSIKKKARRPLLQSMPKFNNWYQFFFSPKHSHPFVRSIWLTFGNGFEINCNFGHPVKSASEWNESITHDVRLSQFGHIRSSGLERITINSFD